MLHLGELTLNNDDFLNSMIGEFGKNDVDLAGASLSLFNHDSVQDMEFDRFNATGSSKKKAIHTGNFKPDEDLALVRAWQEISLDAVVGKDQLADRYWTRIEERFIFHIGRKTKRTLKSLINRWGTIQENCNRWMSCRDQVKKSPPSGSTFTQYVRNLVISLPHFHYFDHCHHIVHFYVLG